MLRLGYYVVAIMVDYWLERRGTPSGSNSSNMGANKEACWTYANLLPLFRVWINEGIVYNAATRKFNVQVKF